VIWLIVIRGWASRKKLTVAKLGVDCSAVSH